MPVPRPSMPSTPRRARLGAVALALVLAGALVACSSDGSDGGAAKDRTTTTAADGGGSTTTAAPTSTTEAASTTTNPANTTTVVPSGNGSGSYEGPVDGQDGVVVRFERADGVLHDFTAEGIAVTCQPLGSGEETTTAVDVVLDDVPVAADGRVEYADQDADLSPSVSAEFNAAGQLVGSISLNGEQRDHVCGGEFSFAASAR